MTLKAKLIGMALLAMSIIGFMTAMTVGMTRTSSSTISRVFNKEMVPALALGAIDTSLRRIHNRILGTLTDYYPFEGSRLALADSKGIIQGSWELINESGALALLDAEEREQFRRIEAFLPKLWAFAAELDEVYRQEDLAALKALQDARWTEIHVNLLKPIQHLHPHFAAHAATSAMSGIAESKKHEQRVIIAAVLGAMLMLPLLAWITLRISAGVKTLQDGLDRLARNQYQEDTSVTSNDEMGAMASSLNKTAAHLRADREEILALKKRNELILDSIGGGLYGTDARGVITFINPAGAAMTGWTVPELIGLPSHATLHHTRPDGTHYPQEECPMYFTYQDGKVHKTDDDVFWRRDGTPLDVQLVSSPIVEEGCVTGAVVVFGDISIRKEAERVIRETLKELRVSNQKLAEANVRMELYHSAMERIGDADPSFSASGDADAFYHSILTDVISLTGAKYGAVGLFDADGKLQQFLTRGISDEELKKIGPLPVGKGLLHAFYQESKIARVDRIADDPRACGFPPGHPPMQSLLGMPLRVNGVTKGVIYLADRDGGEPFTEQDEMLMEMLAQGVAHILERNEMQASLRESYLALTREREEQQLLIAKLEEAQNQLLQSEKMASIGQLAAGVAHEINNPIGYVYSNLGSLNKYIRTLLGLVEAYEKAESAIGDGDGEALSQVRAAKQGADLEFLREDVAALLSESQEGITRVKKIVQNLKDFSHVDESEWLWTDLHQGLDSTLNIVWNEIKYKAEVIKVYGELPEVECLASQLNQVFMNLLVNASHAIEDRGIIFIRTGMLGDDQVWVEIADSGKGIPAENLNRIFDPFFTTKPVGKGTGLGLSLSYSIVQKHHGRIFVSSEEGVGTVFRIFLPIKQPEPVT